MTVIDKDQYYTNHNSIRYLSLVGVLLRKMFIVFFGNKEIVDH